MNAPDFSIRIQPDFKWQEIDTVLLDMDGTLLDSYFDDYFWEEFVPKVYAEKHRLSVEDAKEAMLARYRRVEKTLQWSNLDYWSEQLELDIAELKTRIDYLIQVQPHVIDFLEHITATNKHICLITNAHPKTLEIKLGKTGIGHYFKRIVPAEEIGLAKEQTLFWSELQTMLGFKTSRTLLVDDNLHVLEAAASHGLQHLVHVAKPSSRLPTCYSGRYPSIVYFNELMP